MLILKKLLFLLSSPERKHAVALMGMILVMAFLDMRGVASILPFMAALEQTVDCFVASLLAMTCFDFETSSRATQSRGDPARSAFNA